MSSVIRHPKVCSRATVSVFRIGSWTLGAARLFSRRRRPCSSTRLRHTSLLIASWLANPEQLFLTHYSRVGNVQRLASQMHAGIDAYVSVARQHEHDNDRSAVLRESLSDYYAERLEEHGYAGDREMMREVLGIDIELNAQGLEVWLKRGK